MRCAPSGPHAVVQGRTAERLSAEGRSKRRKLEPGVTAARLDQFTRRDGAGLVLQDVRTRVRAELVVPAVESGL
jgi:hypothetical protein